MKVFIGYDAREDIAWRVCRHAILRHGPGLAVHPLRQEALRELGLYTRPPDQAASTAFSLTRFLTPWLAATEGWSLFADCDILFTTDLRQILERLDPAKAVHVVQHDYVPRQAMKMDGQMQQAYPRKNWSSLMVFNGAHPAVRALTPEVVNRLTPAELHRFAWVADDAAIGALAPDWNFLVGEYDPPAAIPRGIHYTNGGPWFAETREVDYGELWETELALCEASQS
ncbi:hypothetical protein KTR66_03515 [Roseococcus sp. SDR]|uniref:hypothetical protein n=1 Tax=Roseococcus sp. SDR TaxID=2835532 RepID=UPI001BCCF68F|nr:hypothetical protein [Roseococcus sp. SDR]MBS7789047.1 hypothetical protein [Roseococcus sp. SDR]MBV1844361.1 hypothetical protein [Roseococcus sp. SDR]